MIIKRFLFIILLCYSSFIYSQDIVLSFSAQDESSNELELQKITIDNLTTNKTITLENSYSVNLSASTLSTLVYDTENSGNGKLEVFPNPTSKDSNIFFYNTSKNKSTILIVDALGREVAKYSKIFDVGRNTLRFTPNKSGVFFIQLNQGAKTYYTKILATNTIAQVATIKEVNSQSEKKYAKNNLFFTLGDQLKYTAFYKESKHVIFDTPSESIDVNFKINSVFYLDTNGVTIKAYDDIAVGTESFFQGFNYKLVDNEMLAHILEYKLPLKVVTSKISNMDNLFNDLRDFNEDISTWDVSRVTSMQAMFFKAESFNGDLSYWDVSKVTDMRAMFFSAKSFNSDLSSWDVQNVTDTSVMFSFADVFNQDISEWNVEKVVDMNNMFGYATSFNKDISSWNVSNVQDMSKMFQGARAFNQDIGSWNVSNVTLMNDMFESSVIFNQNISTWDVSNVENMSEMFYGAAAFNQDIGSWNVGNVADMSKMFQGAISFNQDISSWSTTNVINMAGLFKLARSFNQNISSWNVSNVKNMDEMFYGSDSFNQDISKWYVCSVSEFNNFTNLSSRDWPEAQKPFFGEVSKCHGEYPELLFYLDNNGVTVKATDIALVGSKGVINGFVYELVDEEKLRYSIKENEDLRYIVTSGITNMESLLESESFINSNKNISSWDVSSVKNMSRMFYRTRYLFPDISFWDVGNVEDMSEMFKDSESVAPDLSSWNVSKVTNMSGMFRNAYSFDSDINSWDVSNVVNMESMFREVHSFSYSINSWDVSNVKNMAYMFRDTRYYVQDLNQWNVENVVNMTQMFYSSSYKQDLSNWNVCNVNEYSSFTSNNLWIAGNRPNLGDPDTCSGD